MKQKYLILKDNETNELIIREFAELDKDILSLVCEERFNVNTIASVIPKGKYPLMAALRTQNMYPPALYAGKIADAVLEMIRSNDAQPVELLFDDMEYLAKDQRVRIPPEIVGADTGETEEEVTAEYDEFLEEEIEDEFEDETQLTNLNSPLRIADEDALDTEEES